MTKPNIEASFSGLKLSYVRFISDSAPGFVVLLLVIFGGQKGSLPWWAYHKELKVLVATLAFFLATPVGLSLNAISYFLLGHIQSQINRICFLSEWWPVSDAYRTLMVQKSRDHFKFTACDWAERNDVYGELVESYRPDLTFRIEHLRGLKRFTRSISFLSFVCFFYLKPGGWRGAISVAAIILVWSGWIFIASRPDSEAVEKAEEPERPEEPERLEEPGKPKPRRFADALHELGIVIMLAALVLFVCASVTGVTFPKTDPLVDEPFQRICVLGIALVGLLVAGMVDFYQRATIAMYLHIECPPTDKDLMEIQTALIQSAKGIGSGSS